MMNVSRWSLACKMQKLDIPERTWDTLSRLKEKAYMSSTTRADAPPPPLQMAPTPYFPPLCLNT